MRMQHRRAVRRGYSALGPAVPRVQTTSIVALCPGAHTSHIGNLGSCTCDNVVRALKSHHPRMAAQQPVSSIDRLARASSEAGWVALLERHRSGDQAALNELMRAIYPSIRRIIFRFAGPRRSDVSEDLVQAALEQICRSLHHFEGRSRLSTFVFGICHRVVARHRRYDRVRSWYARDAEEATLPQTPLPPDALLERAHVVADARRALDGLDGEERAAFVLHEVEELQLDEVAEVLRCSTRTVKRRLRAAREKLLTA
jgi:RNA polymerase sigma-70 factor (ECF subfamily)